MRAYIFDIDGTVADGEHRRHHVTGERKDWKSFHEEMHLDPPILHMRPLIHALWHVGYVIYVTGRMESGRDVTVRFLIQHQFDLSGRPLLYMRRDGDYRDDVVVKLEILAQIRADGYVPMMAFDDRKRVVDMWRREGIPCMHVAEGDF